MSDESTAETLVLVGAILQIIGAILMIGGGGIGFIFDVIFGYLYVLDVVLYSYDIIGGIIGLVFSILWFQWRSDVVTYKTNLLITGIIGMILAGFIGGLLVMIGSIIAPSESV